MKYKKYIKFLCCFIIFTLLIGTTSANAADFPDKIKITIDKEELYKVQYDDFYISARRIRLEGDNDVAYCLEIEKNYPSGQNFALQGDYSSKEINNILAVGYPSKSPMELNLSNENEAYFATQVAIWSSLEGYDVDKIKGDNPKIVEAIKNIYKEGVTGNSLRKIESKVYKIDNESVQEIVVVKTNNLTEEQAEMEQVEYPNQEG